jgi:hypothetical protein
VVPIPDVPPFQEWHSTHTRSRGLVDVCSSIKEVGSAGEVGEAVAVRVGCGAVWQRPQPWAALERKSSLILSLGLTKIFAPWTEWQAMQPSYRLDWWREAWLFSVSVRPTCQVRSWVVTGVTCPGFPL